MPQSSRHPSGELCRCIACIICLEEGERTLTVMVVRIVLAHDDRAYSDDLLAALAATGLVGAAVFSDPLVALDALGHRTAELLITRIDFGAGRLHGVALARMARTHQTELKVILLGERKYLPHVAGIGEFILLATAPVMVAARAREVLANGLPPR